jgi:hypothetical protein
VEEEGAEGVGGDAELSNVVVEHQQQEQDQQQVTLKEKLRLICIYMCTQVIQMISCI